MPLQASSSFRRHGQRDDRRRRLLTDELANPERVAHLSGLAGRRSRSRRSRNTMGMPTSWNANYGCWIWSLAGW